MKKLILLLLFSLIAITCFAEEFDPFPLNRGSIYEYSDDDIPDVCFFPINTSQWNGNEVTTTNWGKLTDFQKAQFVSEGLKELVDKEQIEEQEIDGWPMIMALNHMSSSMKSLEPNLSMIAVLRDLLQGE